MGTYPVRVYARPDAPGRWLWLVKWLLLIPHYVVLFVLWTAFVVLTLVAYVAVLFTGRYPPGVFDFNVGVLRWTWRVGYYGYGVLGTDRYPPFTLADVPDYPARLDIDGPPSPPRWLPLVAWLFALPQLLIVGALTSGGGNWASYEQGNTTVGFPGGVVGIVVLVVGIALLFTGRHLRGLHDLLVGIARWSLRTVAYVALLTDVYPPFRLDQGSSEPVDDPTGGPSRLDEPSTPAAKPTLARPPSTPVAPTAPRGTGAGVAGRIVALVAGVLLLLTGGGMAIGGAAVLGLSASRTADGYITGPELSLSTATAAITAEGIVTYPGNAVGRQFSGLDAVRITASSPSGVPLFLGVAREADVDTWLRGAAHDELQDVYGGGDSRYVRSPGVTRSVTPPADQPFWLATASGSGTIRLDWSPDRGRFAIVLANADGSPSVVADATAAAKLPALQPIGTTLLILATLLGLTAAVLIYVGAVGLTGRTGGQPAKPTAPVPPPNGPPPNGPPPNGPPPNGPPPNGPPSPSAPPPAVLSGSSARS